MASRRVRRGLVAAEDGHHWISVTPYWFIRGLGNGVGWTRRFDLPAITASNPYRRRTWCRQVRCHLTRDWNRCKIGVQSTTCALTGRRLAGEDSDGDNQSHC